MSRIIIDMDGVMADTYPLFIDRYEARFGRRPQREELLGHKVYDLAGGADIRNAMYEPGFFQQPAVMTDAPEVVAELYEEHEVFVVSTASEFKHAYLDKWEWLNRHFPFIHFERIVFCGDKRIVHGDYMIDDKASNLAGFNGAGLLFDSYDNHYEEGYHRVHDWGDVREYFRAERRRKIAVDA